MTHITRRAFGLAAVSTPLTLAATSGGYAASHAAPAVVPGVFQAPLGSYRISALHDGTAPLQRAMFFGPAPEAIDAVLSAAGDSGPTLPAPVTAFLLQSADRTILIDAGMGDVPMFGPGFGRIVQGLASLGVAPEDVDTIVLTHAHPDHLGGLVSGAGVTYPNAELVALEAEHGFWTDPAMAAQAPAEAQGLFTLVEQVFGAYGASVRLVAPGAEIAPGVRLDHSPGHTPGHGIVHIDGGDRQLLMVADTVHNVTLHTALPDIGFGFDTDTALAAQSRRAVFDRAAADNILIAGSHVHFPGFGRILADGDVYRFLPATWL